MPRKAKPQQPAAPTGQDYGDHQAQIQAQQDMPLPDMQAQGGAPAAPVGAPVAPPGAPPAGNPLEAALAMPPPEPAPWTTGVPDEQITAGLPSGPGPGPEALAGVQTGPRESPIVEMLMEMGRSTGNPYFIERAQIARRQAQ